MIRKTQKNWSILGSVLLGAALAGCGNDAAQNSAAIPESNNTATSQTTSQTATNSSAVPAELTAFFPDATLTRKQFPLDADAAAHLSEMAKVKFTGAEKEWEVYEVAQNGQRLGYAMMTHLNAAGRDTHVVFAVDKNFKITRADVIDAPAMKPFVTQAVGKNQSAKWKLGQDFKLVPSVSSADAQAVIDALHKGVVILEENFNPQHGAHETAPSSAAGHGADDGHNH